MTFAVPGDLATPTGGYAYARRVTAELRGLGWQVDALDIGEGFPHATEEKRTQALTLLEQAPADAPLVIDGLALGALPDEARVVARSHRLVGLVHHPLALETGLSEAEAAALRASERAALQATCGVIASSPFTGRLLAADYGVPTERIAIAEPGTDRVPFAQGSGRDTVHVLAVGAVSPRKGYDRLVAALATLVPLPWRLTIAGDLARDGAAVDTLRALVAATGLGGRVTLAGVLSEHALADAYRTADLFVQPSRLEGYGMAAATALAYGLPVVATQGGALEETLRGAALVVPDADFADALRQAIAHPATRAMLRDRARAAARTLPAWRDTAARFARAVEAAA